MLQNTPSFITPVFIAFGIGAVIIGFILYQLYFYVNPHARLNFTVFKPGQLSTQQDTLVIYTPAIRVLGATIDTIIAPTVRVEYTLSSKNIRVLQEKNKNRVKDCSQELAPNCILKITPKGQRYLIVTENTFADPAHQPQRATLLMKGTFITLVPASAQNTPLSEADWNELIDSLEQVDFNDAPVQRLHPGA